MTAKSTTPPHVVFIADEREKYISEVSLPNVSYVVKPGLNFENAINLIKQNPHYGKGTIFVSFCGLFSLAKSCLNSTCIENKCRTPYPVLQTKTQKSNLMKKAVLLKEKFYKENKKDELVFCELIPVLSNSKFTTLYPHKCEHAPAPSSMQSHDINLEIDCFNDWVIDAAKKQYPQIKMLNLKSREINDCTERSHKSGLMPPQSIKERRKKLISNIRNHFRVKLKPPVVTSIKSKPNQVKQKCKLVPQVTSSTNLKQFDCVVLVANVAYRQYLEHLKSSKVMIVAIEDLNSDNISTLVSQHSHVSHGKSTLWIFISGIFSVVQPFINPECNSSCIIPLLKVAPLEDYKSNPQKRNIINQIFSIASGVKKDVKTILGSSCSVMFSPLVPGQMMNLARLNHEEQHWLHQRYNGILCVDGNHMFPITSLYNTLCNQWLPMCRILMKEQGILTKDLTDYAASTKGSHVELYFSANKYTCNLLQNWIDFMKLFIGKMLKSDVGINLYKDLDSPSAVAVEHNKESAVQTYCRKFNHIVFIGPKSLCQLLEDKLSIGTSFIEENLSQLDFGKVTEVGNSFGIYPANSLFIVLFDKDLISGPLQDEDYLNIDEISESFLVPKNFGPLSGKPKNVPDMVDEAILNAQTMLNILKKKTPINSSVIICPMITSAGLVVVRKLRNLEILKAIRKERPDVLFLYGKFAQWTSIVNILKMKWKKFLMDVFKKEKLSAKIPLDFMNIQRYLINVVLRPDIIAQMKDDLKESWIKCLEQMYSFFLNMDFSLPDMIESSADNASSSSYTQVNTATEIDFGNSLSDLRETINQARRERRIREMAQQPEELGHASKCTLEESMVENLVVTIRSKCFAAQPSPTPTAKYVDSSPEKVDTGTVDVGAEKGSSKLSLACKDEHGLFSEVTVKQEALSWTPNIKVECTDSHDQGVCTFNENVEELTPIRTCKPSVKQEISNSEESKSTLKLLLPKGQFSLNKLPEKSPLDLATLQVPAFSLQELDKSFSSLVDHKIICNFTFGRVKGYVMEARHSLLPRRLSCVLGFGIGNLLAKFPNWDYYFEKIGKYFGGFQRLLHLREQMIASLPKVKCMKITCPKEVLLPRRTQQLYFDAFALLKSSSNKYPKKEIKRIETKATNKKILIKIPHTVPKNKYSPVRTQPERKPSTLQVKDVTKKLVTSTLQVKDVTKVTTKNLATDSSTYTRYDRHRRCLILCQGKKPASAAAVSPNVTKADSPPKPKTKQHPVNAPLNNSQHSSAPLSLRPKQALQTYDKMANYNGVTPTCIGSKPVEKSTFVADPVTTSEQNITTFINRSGSGYVYAEKNQMPTESRPVTQLDSPRKKTIIVKLKVSGISSSYSTKFIRDLSIACGCEEPPLQIDGGYVLKFVEELTPAIFMKTFHGKRLCNSKISVTVFEGTILERNLPRENELSKCLLNLLEIHQAYLASILQTQYLHDIDICTYKVMKCLKTSCQEKTMCVNYHSKEDRRRFIKDGDGQYISTLCKKGALEDRDSCPWGDECRLAHNEVEQTFHPMKYKKELCPETVARGTPCSRTDFCSFVHPGTADALYHDSWKDVYVTGLEQSLAYLVGAVRMMRRVIFKTGIMALFITPSMELLSFARSVVAPIADVNDVNVLFLTKKTTLSSSDFSSIHLVGGTPSSVWTLLAQNSRDKLLANLRVLILDDISALLGSTSISRVTMEVLDIIRGTRKYPHPLNQVVVGETAEEGLLRAASTMLQTRFVTVKSASGEPRHDEACLPVASNSSKKQSREGSEEVYPEAKRKRVDINGTSVLKDKSNFVSGLAPQAPQSGALASKPSRSDKVDPPPPASGKEGEPIIIIDDDSIDDLLTRSRSEITREQSKHERSKLNLAEQTALRSFEERLEQEHYSSFKEIMRHPNNDPDYERKLTVFAFKYQTHFGATLNTEHFKELWKNFWEMHVRERMGRELIEKKRKLIQIFTDWKQSSSSKSSNNDVPEKLTCRDPFLPMVCSSPKTNNHIGSVTSTQQAAASLVANSDPLRRVVTSSHLHPPQRDRSFEPYSVTNYKRLFGQHVLEEQGSLNLSEISEEELSLQDGAFSPISDTSVPSPSPCRSHIALTKKGDHKKSKGSHGDHRATSSSSSLGRNGEAKVEKAILSLGEAITTFSHLTSGFRHIVASFDDKLSVAENVKRSLQEEDNVVLFLLIKDSLEFYLGSSKTDSQVRKRCKSGLKECQTILSIAPEKFVL